MILVGCATTSQSLGGIFSHPPLPFLFLEPDGIWPKKVDEKINCVALAPLTLASSATRPAVDSATMSIYTREASNINALRTVNAKHKHMEMLLLDRLEVRARHHDPL